MAANYEVNIQLNTKALDKELDKLDKRIANLGRGTGGRGGGGSKNPPRGRLDSGGQFKSDINALYKAKVKNLDISRKIDILEIKGVNTNKMRVELGKLNTAQGKRYWGTLNKQHQVLNLMTKSSEKALAKQKLKTAELKKQTLEFKKQSREVQRNAPRSSIGGSRSQFGSPAQLKYSGGPSSPIMGAPGIMGSPRGQMRGMRNPAVQSALISGAFPLLFGQGPATALAGAAGGFAGQKMGGQMGGFAGGIAATAAVQTIASAVNAVADLGKAMGPYVQDTNALIEATGQANTFRAKELALIEKLEGKQAAFNEVMKDMEDIVGVDGVKALETFGEDMTRLNKNWDRFMLNMSAGFARLLNWSGLFGGGKESSKSILGRAKKLEGDEELSLLLAERASIADSFRGKRGKRRSELEANLLLIRERMSILDDKAKIDGDIKLEQMEQQALLADKIEKAYIKIGETIRNDITEGIKGLIKGTSTLSDVLNNVADKFLDIAINQGMYGNVAGQYSKGSGIFGMFAKMFSGMGGGGGGWKGIPYKLPGMAAGGPVTGGNPYVVGEKGPELFVPRSGGNIIPNNAMGNVTVNVDASGSAAQGDGPSSEQLGQLIGAAIQNELIRQKRPGGLLG